MKTQQQIRRAAIGPIIGVEPAENGTFRPAIYHPVDRRILRLSDKRLNYGEAFEAAAELAAA